MGRIRYVHDKMQSFHFPQITPKTRDREGTSFCLLCFITRSVTHSEIIFERLKGLFKSSLYNFYFLMGFILLMHKQFFMIKFKREQCGVGKEKRFENESDSSPPFTSCVTLDKLLICLICNIRIKIL